MNNIPDLIETPGGIVQEVRGRMGGTVYYVRNGRQCARTHVEPANPRTRDQQKGRTRFAHAVRRWRALDECRRQVWNNRAKRMNMSGYNLFISSEMRVKRRVVRKRGRIVLNDYVRQLQDATVLIRPDQCGRHQAVYSQPMHDGARGPLTITGIPPDRRSWMRIERIHGWFPGQKEHE